MFFATTSKGFCRMTVREECDGEDKVINLTITIRKDKSFDRNIANKVERKTLKLKEQDKKYDTEAMYIEEAVKKAMRIISKI